jgi:hypothetical protein
MARAGCCPATSSYMGQLADMSDVTLSLVSSNNYPEEGA